MAKQFGHWRCITSDIAAKRLRAWVTTLPEVWPTHFSVSTRSFQFYRCYCSRQLQSQYAHVVTADAMFWSLGISACLAPCWRPVWRWGSIYVEMVTIIGDVTSRVINRTHFDLMSLFPPPLQRCWDQQRPNRCRNNPILIISPLGFSRNDTHLSWQ